jgi:hypothetical protein
MLMNYVRPRNEELRTPVFDLGRDREFADCPLEESGFELAVPSERSVAKQEAAPLCRLPRVLGKARSGPVDMFQGVSITEATSAMNAA